MALPSAARNCISQSCRVSPAWPAKKCWACWREASSANRSKILAPLSVASSRPVSRSSDWLTSWMTPARLQTTSTSDIEVSTETMNCCDSSSAVFLSSSATSY